MRVAANQDDQTVNIHSPGPVTVSRPQWGTRPDSLTHGSLVCGSEQT